MKTNLFIAAITIFSFNAIAQTDQNTSKTNVSVNTSTRSLVTTATSSSWVDQKIEEIKPQRNGLSTSSLARLKSPFIVIVPEKKDGGNKAKTTTATAVTADIKSLSPTKKDMSKEPLTLQILLNSSALINGKWLKENDTFRGYKLAQIQNSFVVLERKNKKIKLFIAQKNKNINISTK